MIPARTTGTTTMTPTGVDDDGGADEGADGGAVGGDGGGGGMRLGTTNSEYPEYESWLTVKPDL